MPRASKRDVTHDAIRDVAHGKSGGTPLSQTARRAAQKAGLTLVSRDELTLRRRKQGRAFGYVDARGCAIARGPVLRRLKRLAMPPAYEDVRYAADPRAHLQAIGRDAAGRWQYRYHPDWERVRELRKAKRLARLVDALPRIRRAVARHLAGREPTRDFALAAVIELIAHTAIRPGHEAYAKIRGTRGATTLLKSNVEIERGCIVLNFKAKGGKQVRKECGSGRLRRAVKVLRKLSGPRLFQFRDDDGAVHQVDAMQVNNFLREIAATRISLKDLRTLLASAAVMDSLARIAPEPSARGRKRQLLEAVRNAADELANTPAICRKSYVHETVVSAFETGMLQRFAPALKSSRSPAARESILAQLVKAATL
jgi:DNA topoisomerase-1